MRIKTPSIGGDSVITGSTVRVMLFFFLLILGLYYGRALLVPLCLAALFSFLLLPLTRRFEKWGLHRIPSIILCIFFLFLVFGGIIALLSSQVVRFANDIPQFQEKISGKLTDIQSWIENQTGANPDFQIDWAREKVNELLSNSGAFITTTISGAANVFAGVALIPIYTFFFLYYREKYRKFIFKITAEESHQKVDTIINTIGEVVQMYLRGVLTVIFILAILNCTVLGILGIPYALFLGVLAAVLNIVPYIGVLIGSSIAVLVAFLTKDSLWSPIIVMLCFWGIQTIENNFLTPNITGSRVSINPLAAIVALILGSMIWGVIGMILFIPFLGILKVICDNIAPLRPYGYLLGTEDTDSHRPSFSGLWNRIRGWLGLHVSKEGELDD